MLSSSLRHRSTFRCLENPKRTQRGLLKYPSATTMASVRVNASMQAFGFLRAMVPAAMKWRQFPGVTSAAGILTGLPLFVMNAT